MEIENALVMRSREFFCAHIIKYGDPFGLGQHVSEANRWAERLLTKENGINPKAIFIAVWLHDIGHYPTDSNDNHAVVSHRMAKKFLEENGSDSGTMELALSCVRSHRALDIQPVRREEKLFVAIDSVSHLTGNVYLDMSVRDKQNGVKLRAFEKIERDKRDICKFPSLWAEVSSLYDSWVRLLTEFEKIS